MGDFGDKLRSVLSHCLEHREIIGLHLWEDAPESFLVGYVLAVGEESLTLEDVAADAMASSITEIAIGHIGRFHLGSAYLRRVDTLYRNRAEVYQPADPLPQFIEGALYADTLRLALQRRWVVTVWEPVKKHTEAFVTEVGDDYFSLEVIDEGGAADGVFVFQTSDIAYLSVNGRNEQSLAFLHRHLLGR